MRVAIAGSGGLALSAILPLLDSHHEVVAFLQNGRRTRGMQRVLNPMLSLSPAASGGVVRMGWRRGIPTVWLDRMDVRELEPLRRLEPDVIVVAGFGIILKPTLLELPRLGCVNVHPSLLPRHRGPNPFVAVVLAGDRDSGVSFHQMNTGIDTGPLLAQFPFPLGPRETAATVYGKTCAAAGEHVVDVLDALERGDLTPQAQDESLATYDPRPADTARELDWNRSAACLDRQVRAFSAFSPAWFRVGRRAIHLIAAHADHRPVSAPPGTVVHVHPWLRVATGDGSLRVVHAVEALLPSLRWPTRWTRLRPGDRL